MKSAAEYRAEIERLIPKAESGDDWAEICLLEDLMIEAQALEAEANRNFPFSGSF